MKHNLESLEKRFTAVTLEGNRYILASEAVMQDDGETYIADAYDMDLNKFAVYFETTAAWKNSQEIYKLEQKLEDARSNIAYPGYESYVKEIESEIADLEKLNTCNIEDESNACDWESPVKVVAVDLDTYFKNDLVLKERDLLTKIKNLEGKTFLEGVEILGLNANDFSLTNDDDCYDLNLELSAIDCFCDKVKYLITFTLNDPELFAEEEANETDENLIEARFSVWPERFDCKGYWHYNEIK